MSRHIVSKTFLLSMVIGAVMYGATIRPSTSRPAVRPTGTRPTATKAARLANEEKVRARHILFAANEKEKAAGVLEQIREGSLTFEEALAEYSIDYYTKRSGGDLGFFTRRTSLAPAVKAIAFKMKKGEYVKEPVKTQFGWHILQVTDRTGKKEDPPPPPGEEPTKKLEITMTMKLADPKFNIVLPLEKLSLNLSAKNISDAPVEVLRPELWPLGVSLSANVVTESQPELKADYLKIITDLKTVTLLPGQGISQTLKVAEVWDNLDQSVWWDVSFKGADMLDAMTEKFAEKMEALKKEESYTANVAQLAASMASEAPLGFDTHKVSAKDKEPVQYYVVVKMTKGQDFLVKLQQKENMSQVLHFIKLVQQDFYKDKKFHKRQKDEFIAGGGLGQDGTGWPERGKFVTETILDKAEIKAKDFILVARRDNYSYECGSMFMVATNDLPQYKEARMGLPIGTVVGGWRTIENLDSDTGWMRARQSPIASTRLYTEAQLPTIWKSELAASKGPVESDEPLPQVEITTEHGVIKVELYEDDAPNTVANFISLAEKKYYDGLTFHRVIAGFVAQGGDPQGTGAGGPGYTIRDEVNGRKHVKGALGMAKTRAPNSAGSQFYFCLEAAHHLDAGYTVFGKVLSGMDAVAKIKKGDKMTQVKVLSKRDHPYVPEKI